MSRCPPMRRSPGAAAGSRVGYCKGPGYETAVSSPKLTAMSSAKLTTPRSAKLTGYAGMTFARTRPMVGRIPFGQAKRQSEPFLLVSPQRSAPRLAASLNRYGATLTPAAPSTHAAVRSVGPWRTPMGTFLDC